MSRPPTPLADRFWPKVAEGDNGCWVWTGCRSGVGYGQIWSMETQSRLNAHRVSWELMVGEIPEGLVIDHLCKNRACVNPEHLEPVPMKVNTDRGGWLTARKARAAALTHCKHGHEYTPENTKRTTKGFRYCRTCTNERAAGYRAARRERAAA